MKVIKLNTLPAQTQRTVRLIAKSSNMTEKEVLLRMERTFNADMVTTHLNYGINK